MTLKGVARDYRTYASIFAGIVFISGVLGGWFRFPERLAEAEGNIEVNEEDIEDNKDSVGSLADTVSDYILRQDIAQVKREESDKEYRELMLRYIDKK